MSAIQLSFSLRVSSGVKTVHLLGSWDNYVGQLPLSRDKASSKSGSWKGTFRFQNATLEAGQRYWYYYIVDGYHVAHNPGVESVTEPTTGRELNILDVPKSGAAAASSSSSKSSATKERSSRQRGTLALEIPQGRPLSISQIKAPKPVSPHATKHILSADYYGNEELEELTARFRDSGLGDEEEFITKVCASPISSTGSSLSYRSDGSVSDSNNSGYSTPASDCSSCSCERYGITRKGERVRLDCGGSVCGYGSSDSDSCSSEDEEEYDTPVRSARRNGIVVN
ncbi:hypothetical protein ESCO_006206 [Escovopsis weberi]|uniref:GTP-binding protein EsdC n=1 Tax=Escovopsis weberi TaxID=150374 RepID=A0A0N0RTL8_ESCWE|nr:hypothetical protein ESCO_006206 [Escovopsis weberi]